MHQNTQDIFEQLSERYRDDDSVSLEMIDGVEPVINVVLADHGDMQVQVAAAGDQIFVSTLLAPADRVKDVAEFNEICLRLNPQYPLSNIGITQVDGKDVYTVFGQLSSTSSIDQVDEEIVVLAENTIQAAESLKPFFN